MSNVVIIKSVQNTGTYNSQHGLMYKQEVELEDGRTGEVSAKKPNRWMAGEMVEITREMQTQHGTKWSFSLAMNVTRNDIRTGNTGSSKPLYAPKPDNVQHQITASWAITNAIAMGCTDGERIKDTARALIAWKETLVGELATLKNESDASEN